MKRRNCLAALLCGAIGCASSLPTVAQTYRVNNLSALASGGLIVGMNKSGQMAGNLPTPGDPLSDSGGGFIYSNGTLSLIPGIGGQTSNASAINNLGQVTGASGNHAFIYSNGMTIDIGALPTIDNPPTDGISVGNSINDSGQVTGYSVTQPDSVYAIWYSSVAFLYSNGVMMDLGLATYSTGRAINNAGDIAGGIGANGAKQPFLYKNGVVTLIGPPNSDQERGDISFAAAINDAGDVVGGLVDGSKTPVFRAFLYSNGTITDLTQLGPGGSGSYLDRGTAINNVGQVLLQSGQVPYLYSGGVVQALSSLIDPTDPLVGVVLKTGVQIYDDGSILVTGNPSVYNGTPTSYLLTAQTLSVTPAPLSFGNQAVGTTSASQLVTVKNNATTTIPINSVTVSGDFVATNNCGATLAPGSSCTIGVTFSPTLVDTRTGTVVITADAIYNVSVSGTGTIVVNLTSSAPTVTVGLPVTLTWASVTQAGAFCTASGGSSGDGWIGQVAANGAMDVTEAAAGKFSYSLTCQAGSQSAVGQVVVTDTLPTVSLSANPTNLTVGQPTTLTWTSTDAASCTASSNGPGDGWTGPKATGGGTASITETTVGLITYTLICTSGPQTAHSSAQVFNNAKPASGGGGGGNMTPLSLVFLLGIFALHMARRCGRNA
jgi:probable HAF family extracellular repeat protein